MPSTLRKKRDVERKERTREVLLDAATRVFSSAGYHTTLISDIVAEAGVQDVVAGVAGQFPGV